MSHGDDLVTWCCTHRCGLSQTRPGGLPESPQRDGVSVWSLEFQAALGQERELGQWHVRLSLLGRDPVPFLRCEPVALPGLLEHHPGPHSLSHCEEAS